MRAEQRGLGVKLEPGWQALGVPLVAHPVRRRESLPHSLGASRLQPSPFNLFPCSFNLFFRIFKTEE